MRKSNKCAFHLHHGMSPRSLNLLKKYGPAHEMPVSTTYELTQVHSQHLIRKLTSGQRLSSSTGPSVLSSHIITVGKAPIENQAKREITRELRAYRRRPMDKGTATVTRISPEEVPWKTHTGPSSSYNHLRRKWQSATQQESCCLSGFDCCIRHCVTQRSVQRTTMLDFQFH